MLRFVGRCAVLCLLAFSASCQFDTDSGEGIKCDAEESCPAGLGCYRGYCIAMAPCANEGTARECFSEDVNLVGVGVCRAGEKMCEDGFLGPCLGQVLPRTEICNTVDDDCDGIVDEIAGMSCETTLLGVCGQGVLACRGGSAVCGANNTPSLEVCNSDDDDCDGEVDEDSNVACYSGASGCDEMPDGSFVCDGVCAPGVRVCTEGELGECVGEINAATEDGCTTDGDAADDDCDGKIDEDCPCELGAEQPCYSGAAGTENTGLCRSGTQTCVVEGDTSRFGECEDQVVPVPETCANQVGTDDDCDGTADNIPRLGNACFDETKKGICRVGTFGCDGSSGALTCLTPTSSEEQCDALDNDCDDKVDETFDFFTDTNHCGSCNNSCQEEVPDCCGECTNLLTSAKHCGACNNSCGEGKVCSEGHCCEAGLTWCDSAGVCVNLQSNKEHCGSCDIKCAAATGAICACNEGSCQGVCL